MTPLSLWRDCPVVAFDLETTGKYPLEAEICEMAAVKWQDGKIVGEFQALIKPSRPMSAEVIAIHNISNEMVASAPHLSEKLPELQKFLSDSVCFAHHAPFDLGFLARAFEQHKIDFPSGFVFCSAILSRRLIPSAANHRLQTLVQHLGLPQGAAHRALDDAKSCLGVAVECLKRVGDNATLADVERAQGVTLSWPRFSIEALKERQAVHQIILAIENGSHIEMVYAGGSRPGQPREVRPMGIVRSLDGDFLVAIEPEAEFSKRYLLAQVQSAKPLG